MWEVWRPHGLTARLWIKWSGFGFWLGTLCCVLGQDNFFSQCLSPPKGINGYQRNGDNDAFEWKVMKAVKAANIGKAHGLDGIPAEVIKHSDDDFHKVH